jgi:peptidoglycan hydrolase CwlO-like protein
MEPIKKFITKNYKIILSILIGLSILSYGFFKLSSGSTMSETDRQKLDSLTNFVNDIKKDQDKLETKVDEVTKEVEKIDENISKIKTNKLKTGKKYHEEITRVDKYSERELDSFFSNRYK